MHTCSSCGYESPGSARFCRQCGVPLLAEHNVTEATTRNFGRQDFPPAPAKSAPLPPPADVAGMNVPRYQQPMQAAPPAYAPTWTPHAPNTSSLRSKSFFQRWGALALALMIGAGLGGAVNQAKNKGRVPLTPEDRERLNRMRAEDQTRRMLTDSVRDQQEALLDRAEKLRDEVDRAADEAKRALERNLTGMEGVTPLDLRDYYYADGGEFSNIPGREMVRQNSKDSYETVFEFFQKKIGRPYLQTTERNVRQAMFQSGGSQSVTVLIQEGRRGSRQTEIIVVRSPFKFPPLQPEPQKPGADAPQPGVAAKPNQNVTP